MPAAGSQSWTSFGLKGHLLPLDLPESVRIATDAPVATVVTFTDFLTLVPLFRLEDWSPQQLSLVASFCCSGDRFWVNKLPSCWVGLACSWRSSSAHGVAFGSERSISSRWKVNALVCQNPAKVAAARGRC